MVHHDRLKPYRARDPAEHNTDWVVRVRNRYAVIRGQEPLPQVMPSTGEETDMYDIEEELVLNVRPDEPVDSAADDELTEDDADRQATVQPAITCTEVEAPSGAASEDVDRQDSHSKPGSASIVAESDDERRSVDEYSVPRLDRHSKVPRRPRSQQWYSLRGRPKPRQMYSP